MTTTEAPFKWRDHLKVHPAADLFPLLSESELRELADDIKQNGLQQPIVIWETGKQLIDGRNRLDALARIGWLRPTGDTHKWHTPIAVIEQQKGRMPRDLLFDFRFSDKSYGSERVLETDADVFSYVISANVHRRHLTAEQKRDLIAKLLKADPSRSDRQIAEQTKTSPTTVGKVRAEKEAAGDVSKVDTRTDSAGRKQPSKKLPAKVKVNGQSVSAAGFSPAAQAKISEALETDDRNTPAPTKLKALRERAGTLGYTVRRRQGGYQLIDADSGKVRHSGHDLESLGLLVGAMEGKIAWAIYTPCGSLRTGDNSKVWLAAHPGATMEDFANALPPALSGCDLDNDPLQPSDEADASPKKRQLIKEDDWYRAVRHFAREAIAGASRENWDRDYGNWHKFQVTDELLLLATEAAKAWTKLATDLSAQQDANKLKRQAAA
jgi:hypothetical protein